MSPDIIVSGHLCLDLLPGMAKLSQEAMTSPGKLFLVDAIEMSTGGSVSNTGLALHRLGVSVGLMSKVGDDLIGRVIIAFLKDRDPNLTDLVKVEAGAASSYTIVLSPANVDRSFLHCPGTNDTFNINDIDFELATQAKIFHLGYPPLLPHLLEDSGSQLAEIFQRVHTAGVVTSMDTAHPDPNSASGQVDWRPILSHVLPHVDVFLPSIEEILFMLRRDDYDRWGGDVLPHITRSYLHDLAGELLDIGVAVTGFKLGALGFYLRTTSDKDRLQTLAMLGVNVVAWECVERWQPAFQVKVAGTTGAGDAAYGGFLAALLHGQSPDEAARLACAVGACNVEAVDATSGVRTWKDTHTRLETDWPVNKEILPDA